MSKRVDTGANSPRPVRKLTALLAIDMVGSSAAMEHDEAGTLARLDDLHTQIIAPEISRGGGRIFKTLGDGYLADFTNTLDALDVAVAIQNAVADSPAAQADMANGVPAIVFRVAIHVGDVRVNDDDLQGDTVNIVARLEQVAGPGQICLSRQAHDHVAVHRRYAFEPIGPQTLRNLNRQIEAFLLNPAHLDGPPQAPRGSVEPPPVAAPALERVIGRRGARLAQRGRAIWLLIGGTLIAVAVVWSAIDAISPSGSTTQADEPAAEPAPNVSARPEPGKAPSAEAGKTDRSPQGQGAKAAGEPIDRPVAASGPQLADGLGGEPGLEPEPTAHSEPEPARAPAAARLAPARVEPIAPSTLTTDTPPQDTSEPESPKQAAPERTPPQLDAAEPTARPEARPADSPHNAAAPRLRPAPGKGQNADGPPARLGW